ncbi:2,3-bisphosphoglycerate-independent phosphoglycerate mutase [Candidatus Parcubacteria bacterium]|nr:2,3-bisphosphoglycerate-independent phosphoglycerate mutase [Candidatus Parcubacteria bacterium]
MPIKNKINSNLPLILIILDGWGLDKPNPGNPISLVKTPTLDGLARKYPSTGLKAHGKHVGLPTGQVGNSEAGHMNIGAGRLVEQDSVRISKSISDGTFYKNSAFLGAIRHIQKMNSKMHIVGMLSNGQSPHSDPGHLLALLKLMKQRGVGPVFLHLFTDGRDSPKYASLKLIYDLQRRFTNDEVIATVMGRFYAMDRKKKWDRTAQAYNALIKGDGLKAVTAREAVTEAYNRGESDEFISPFIINKIKGRNTRIKDGDSVIFFNLRSDRGRQLSKAFVQNDFNKMNRGAFKRPKKLKHLYFVAMTDFGPDLDDILTAYPSFDIRETLPMQLKDLRQLYITETEKYAHVTYFFNGGYSGTVAGEEQCMVPSPDVKSYDQTPTMSSDKLCRRVIRNLRLSNKRLGWKYDFTLLNFAAPDMIGHTGNLEAAKKTVKHIDKYVSEIVKAYLAAGGTAVITADHGNIEKMINLETQEIYTEHTANLVPFIIVNRKLKNKIKLKSKGILSDIAPTILKLAGCKKPKEMKRSALY